MGASVFVYLCIYAFVCEFIHTYCTWILKDNGGLILTKRMLSFFFQIICEKILSEQIEKKSF